MTSTHTEPQWGRHKSYTVAMAYRMAILDLMGEDHCPRTVEVFARDIPEAIEQARQMIPHVYGITSVVELGGHVCHGTSDCANQPCPVGSSQ